jgi:hypothetical protein
VPLAACLPVLWAKTLADSPPVARPKDSISARHYTKQLFTIRLRASCGTGILPIS